LEASYAFSVSSELALAKQLAGIAVGDQGVSYNRGLMRNRSKATSNSLLGRGCAVLECRCRPRCPCSMTSSRGSKRGTNARHDRPVRRRPRIREAYVQGVHSACLNHLH